MNAKLLKAEFDQYKRSYKLIVARNTQLEEQWVQQEARIELLGKSLEQCQRGLDLNKTLMRQLGEEHNKKENELVALLTGLKAKLREMGYNGDFDNLGHENN